MSNALAQLVAILLLITQAAASWGPDRVLCLPVDRDGAHGIDGHERDCDHHNDAASIEHEHLCGAHDHGFVVAVLHPRSDCGCHVHVPVRSDDTAPTKPQDRALDAGIALARVAVGLAVPWNVGPAPVIRLWFQPPDQTFAAHVRAIKSTRLRV